MVRPPSIICRRSGIHSAASRLSLCPGDPEPPIMHSGSLRQGTGKSPPARRVRPTKSRKRGGWPGDECVTLVRVQWWERRHGLKLRHGRIGLGRKPADLKIGKSNFGTGSTGERNRASLQRSQHLPDHRQDQDKHRVRRSAVEAKFQRHLGLANTLMCSTTGAACRCCH